MVALELWCLICLLRETERPTKSELKNISPQAPAEAWHPEIGFRSCLSAPWTQTSYLSASRFLPDVLSPPIPSTQAQLLIFATTCQHGTGQLLDIYLLRPRNNWHSLQLFCQVSVGGRWPPRTQPDENEVLEALVLSGQH